MSTQENSPHFFRQEILRLKKEKNAIILAHYYQQPDIQDVADYVGDSLGLSQHAANTNADIIVFAGVHFMAETAKILNPLKKVLLPDLQAGCSLADSCSPEKFKTLVKNHPSHFVVSYINCSAEIKALSDIICTSANAVDVIRSIPLDQKIIFAPDKNLGKYLMGITGRDMVLWDGVCEVHEAFSLEKILKLGEKFPQSELVVHPESEEALIKIANFVGSTTAMINYITRSNSTSFIVATEIGILHQLRKQNAGKILIAAPISENNSCACSECRFMKMNSLEKLYLCLRDNRPEISVPEEIRLKALIPLHRMIAISNNKSSSFERALHN